MEEEEVAEAADEEEASVSEPENEREVRPRLIIMDDAIVAVNTAALREEIYYCGGKRKTRNLS